MGDYVTIDQWWKEEMNISMTSTRLEKLKKVIENEIDKSLDSPKYRLETNHNKLKNPKLAKITRSKISKANISLAYIIGCLEELKSRLLGEDKS